MTEMRRCKKCNRDKLLIDFPYSEKSRGWRRHECRVCHNSRVNLHHIQNRPYRLQYAKKRYASKPISTWTKEQRDRQRELQQAQHARWREAVFEHYGKSCTCCGETESVFLTIDHVNQDGAKHRRGDVDAKSRFYRWLMKNGYPDGFQTLCYNCNCGRYRNGGICPHQMHGGFNDYPAREYAASDRRRKRPAFICEG